MLVARTIFLVPCGVSFQTSNCLVAGRPAYKGHTLMGGPGASCNCQSAIKTNTKIILLNWQIIRAL